MVEISIFFLVLLILVLFWLLAWVVVLVHAKKELQSKFLDAQYKSDLRACFISELQLELSDANNLARELEDKLLDAQSSAKSYQNTCDIQHRQITYQQQQIKEYENKIKGLGKH